MGLDLTTPDKLLVCFVEPSESCRESKKGSDMRELQRDQRAAIVEFKKVKIEGRN